MVSKRKEFVIIPNHMNVSGTWFHQKKSCISIYDLLPRSHRSLRRGRKHKKAKEVGISKKDLQHKG
jgi:hypothetical protein